MTYFDPEEVAKLIRPLLSGTSLERLLGHDPSAIRGARTILNQPGEKCELRRVDRIFTTMGRPDLMALLTEI